MSKQFLKLSVLILGAIGIVFCSIPFIASLFPGANSNDPGILIVKLDEIGLGSSKIYEYNRKPILVSKAENQSGLSVIAFVAIPKFEDPMIMGCSVRPISEYKYIPEKYRDAAFFEACRGVFYDRQGMVMEGSHPKAKRLEVIPSRVSGQKIYITSRSS